MMGHLCHDDDCDHDQLAQSITLRTQNYGEQAFVVHLPGRIAGRATIGHRRISTEMVGDYYWQSGFDDVISGYDLSIGEVMVAVWFEAQHGRAAAKKRWKEWFVANEMKFYSPAHYGHPDAPPTVEVSES